MAFPYFLMSSGCHMRSLISSPMYLIWDLQVFYRGSDSKGSGQFLGVIRIFRLRNFSPLYLH